MPGLAALVWGDLELGSGDAAEVLTQTAGPVLSLHAMLQTGDAEGASALHLRTPDGFQKPLTMPVGLPDTAQIASPLFLEGPAKITDAWFATTATLRVALQGHDGVQGMPDAAGTLRGWQPDPGTPGALIALNESPLPEVGPGFVDLILDNPLMPVLLELADSNGTTRGFGLLPYPSLLRGGLHDAERAAAQMSLMPLDDVWRLSLALMREHTTGVAQNRFSIARLAVRLADATGAETVFGPHVREWLSILFGLDLHVAEDAQGALGDDHGTAWLRESLTSDRPDRGNGMVLTLPAQGIPSLQALVSTRMHMPADQNIAAGPWLVSDAVHAKPLWSVVMPADAPVSADMPVLSQGAETPETQGASSQAQSQTQSQAHWLAPLHLAVILRPRDIPNDTVSLFPVAPDAQVAVPDAAQELDLCVVVTVGDPGEAEAALIALKTQAGLKPFNLVLRLRNGASADSMQPITAKAQNLFEITPK
ncbi:MAG: hypothetical protein ACPG7W_09420, partial [Paracoccaceae bacterium]